MCLESHRKKQKTEKPLTAETNDAYSRRQSWRLKKLRETETLITVLSLDSRVMSISRFKNLGQVSNA